VGYKLEEKKTIDRRRRKIGLQKKKTLQGCKITHRKNDFLLKNFAHEKNYMS
jgi:hypothetical protein